MRELISVIIPAYNAVDTIDRTLASVRAQSWRELEIIVVDDGSRDATAEHVLRHAADDPRIRLIRTANGGVARARNRAIAEARGAWLAPIDADDLWLPNKLEAQMQAALRGGERIGLVYCWYAIIDAADRIIRLGEPIDVEGDVLVRMCMGNFIGNGSSALMRRSAVIAAGGFDPALRDQNAQGCEDLKLYFALAEKHEFAVVRDYLTGYRWTPETMSNDARRMLRSYDFVMRPMEERYPHHRDAFERGRIHMLYWLIEGSVRSGDIRTAGRLLTDLWRISRSAAAGALHRAVRWFFSHRRTREAQGAGRLFE